MRKEHLGRCRYKEDGLIMEVTDSRTASSYGIRYVSIVIQWTVTHCSVNHKKCLQYRNPQLSYYVKAYHSHTNYVFGSTQTRHVTPEVSTQVYMLDCKIWKLFRSRGRGRKKSKCDQFSWPTSDFSDFCNPCFYYRTLTNDVDFFFDKALAEICEHILFALQFVIEN